MRAVNSMVIDFKPNGEPGTRAEFTYHITPATISITGKGRLSVGKDLEAVLRKIEYWHQAPVTKFRIMARQGQSTWHGVRWNGKAATTFGLIILNNPTRKKVSIRGKGRRSRRAGPPRSFP